MIVAVMIGILSAIEFATSNFQPAAWNLKSNRICH